jgi:prepilin-type N-terminal cleavage/methylation domain-containing protein
MRIQRRTNRPAFTLVEMMVAMALCLFIMAIISQAFGAATKTFSTMRTAGQLQDSLRAGTSVIRRDLAAPHFGGPFVAGRNGAQLGDQRLDLPGWVPPQGGFFEIRQFGEPVPGNPASILEPLANPVPDGESLYSSRATQHVLKFTVRLPDAPAAELFCAEAPAAVPNTFAAVIAGNSAFNTGQPVFYSQWAEVHYFLTPNPNNETTPAGLPLYSLRRRVRLLAPQSVDLIVPRDVATPPPQNPPVPPLWQRYPDLALQRPGPNGYPPALPSPPYPANHVIVRFFGPDEVSFPGNRLPYGEIVQKNGLPTGDDILVTNVASFEVKAAWVRNADFNNRDAPPPVPGIFGLYGSSPDSSPMFNPLNGATVNSDAPFDELPRSVLNTGQYVGQRVFDTWYRGVASDAIDWDRRNVLVGGSGLGYLTPDQRQPPLRINVRALQIKIRVWDERAEQARQVTLIQEM